MRRKEVYSSANHLGRWGTLIPKPILTSQCRQDFLSERRGEAEKNNQGEGAVGMQAVFLLVKLPQAQAESRTAVCNVLKKRLLVTYDRHD